MNSLSFHNSRIVPEHCISCPCSQKSNFTENKVHQCVLLSALVVIGLLECFPSSAVQGSEYSNKTLPQLKDVHREKMHYSRSFTLCFIPDISHTIFVRVRKLRFSVRGQRAQLPEMRKKAAGLEKQRPCSPCYFLASYWD